MTTHYITPVVGIDPSAGTLALVCLADDLAVVDKANLGRPFTTLIPERAYAVVSEFLASVSTGVAEPRVFMEAPVVAGARNIQSTVKQAMVSGAVQVAVSEWGTETILLAPATWKKDVGVGGNANKEKVAAWLKKNHRRLYDMCMMDQDLIDAACIALVGRDVVERASRMAAPVEVRRVELPVIHPTRLRHNV